MLSVKISIDELSEMIQLSSKDEGMADLLAKTKEYYLLKRPNCPKTPHINSWFRWADDKSDDTGPR